MKNRVLVIALRILLFLALCGVIALLLFYALRCGVEKYNVSFDTAGGGEVAVVTVVKGEAIDAPEVSRVGYELDGWTVSGVAVEFPYVPSGNVTLSAVWRVKTLEVKFDYGEVKVVVVQYGSGAEVFTPLKEGEYFDGWFTASGEEYSGEAVTQDLNLKAKFTAYDFTFSQSEARVEGANVTGKIVVPDTVTVGGSAFTVTAIAENAFENASTLTAAILPKTVKSVGAAAFKGCTSLSLIDLGGAESVGEAAFSGCAALVNVTGEHSDYTNRVLQVGGDTVFAENSSGEVSVSAERVLGGAFASSAVTRVTLSECVEIRSGAFDGCSVLTAVSAPKLELLASAFNGCVSLETISLGTASIPARAFYGLSALKSVDTKAPVIGAYAFSGTGITAVEVASGALIGEGAFKGCASLVTAGGNPRTVSSYAFSDCTSLTSFTFSSALESLGAFAFDGCLSLGAFEGASDYFFTSDGALYGNDGRLVKYPLAKSGAAILPDFCTYIGARAFDGAIIDAVYGNVLEVGEFAFNGCLSLSAAEFGASLRVIERGAFYGCANLISLTLASTEPPTARDIFDGSANSLRVFVPSTAAYESTVFSDYM